MISADYVVGLTDGEGCFYVDVRPPDKRYQRAKTGIETQFYERQQKWSEMAITEKKKV